MFEVYDYHRELHVLTHSVPTRRASDLEQPVRIGRRARVGPEFLLDPILEDVLEFQVLGVGKTHVSSVAAGLDVVGELLDVIEPGLRSEEHTSELQSLLRTPYAVFCLKTKN